MYIIKLACGETLLRIVRQVSRPPRQNLDYLIWDTDVTTPLDRQAL